jgi:hypothetical protein
MQARDKKSKFLFYYSTPGVSGKTPFIIEIPKHDTARGVSCMRPLLKSLFLSRLLEKSAQGLKMNIKVGGMCARRDTLSYVDDATRIAHTLNGISLIFKPLVVWAKRNL